jgi:hypothetical protein
MPVHSNYKHPAYILSSLMVLVCIVTIVASQNYLRPGNSNNTSPAGQYKQPGIAEGSSLARDSSSHTSSCLNAQSRKSREVSYTLEQLVDMYGQPEAWARSDAQVGSLFQHSFAYPSRGLTFDTALRPPGHANFFKVVYMACSEPTTLTEFSKCEALETGLVYRDWNEFEERYETW